VLTNKLLLVGHWQTDWWEEVHCCYDRCRCSHSFSVQQRDVTGKLRDDQCSTVVSQRSVGLDV